MNKKMYLETERLIIRSFKKTDVKDVFEYLSDETVMEYIEPTMTYEKAVSFVYNAGIKNKLVFAIVLKNINKVIGHLIFHEYTNKNNYEIGWVINKEYWDKGYAMEVSKKIIEYGFEELKIDKIIGETEEKNIKSIKTLKKIGMKKVGKNKDGLIEYEIKTIK
jgi:[ribosomal protein S5]-alanine N-acetyltransferase